MITVCPRRDTPRLRATVIMEPGQG